MATLPSAFKSSQGEAEYMTAYAASLRHWPVPFESMDIPSRFGCTHLVACGPQDAPALVLLHGFFASLTMWALNIADLSREYRVYAVDVMGQPGKSIPDQPIRSRGDFVEWLSSLLDALKIERALLAGMSYGGWVALNYALGAPERVEKAVLLSPAGSFLPVVSQFMQRAMAMMFFPRRFLVEGFMGWLTYKPNLNDPTIRVIYDQIVTQMYLGVRYFRSQPGVMPIAFPEAELRALQVPTLLLIGQQEVVYNPVAALECARALVPYLESDLIPGASHDLTFSLHDQVDARILEFLEKGPARPDPIQREAEKTVEIGR